MKNRKVPREKLSATMEALPRFTVVSGVWYFIVNNTSEIAFSPLTKTSPPRSQRPILALILTLFAAGAAGLSAYGWRQSVLFLIGGLLGASLYHASFGFASAYRKLFVDRDITGVLAHLLMLAIATLLFAPVLASGSAFGHTIAGAVAPVGWQNAIGAFLFGIGMQLGSGCACGTLWTIGGGSASMLLTLLTFCIGSFAGSLTRHLWNLPSLPPISLGKTLGWTPAVILQLSVFLLIAIALWQWNRTNGKQPLTADFIIKTPQSHIKNQWLYGPWPLAAGAFALAFLNWIKLLIDGRPWGVTWGFTLWAAELATAFGWNPTTNPFWNTPDKLESLQKGIFADVTSVMNLGIVLGAVLAAALAGKFAVKTNLSLPKVAAVLSGGFMMGYGALLAFGCNVGAFFSGIASTSLHGWLWIAAALLGSFAGIKLRSLLRLEN